MGLPDQIAGSREQVIEPTENAPGEKYLHR